MKLKERINEWLKSQKLESIKAHAKRVEREANERYNIVQRINKDGSRETYITMDGTRCHTNFESYAEALTELFELRMSYQAEH